MDLAYAYPDDYESTLIPSNLLESGGTNIIVSENLRFQSQRSGTPELPSLCSSLTGSADLSAPSTPSSTRANASDLDSAHPESNNSAITSYPINFIPHFSPRALTDRIRALLKFGDVTVRSGHRPYEQFKDHVKALWQSLSPLQLWKESPKSSSFWDGRMGRFLRSTKFLEPAFRRWNPGPPECEIERLRGGSFNRVIGLTIPKAYHSSVNIDRHFILRIPRDDDARLDRDVATLQFLRDQSSIPVPEAVHADYTCQNPIETPYMIQKRIPGRPLIQIWDELNVEQRCSVARNIGETLCKLQSLTYPAPGTIDSYEAVAKGLRKLRVAPYDLMGPMGLIEESEPETLCTAKGVSLINFFLSQMNRWRKLELAVPPKERSGNALERWAHVIGGAEEMDGLGLLNDKTYSLCHLDLQPRNMMAEIQDNETVKITGYLDWDSAVFAPSFVGCAPPYWMWFEGDEALDEELERGANMRPSDPMNLKVKQAFEDTVGRNYLHFAYQPQYRFARILFRIAKDGIWDPRRARDAENFVGEWWALRDLLLPEQEVA